MTFLPDPEILGPHELVSRALYTALNESLYRILWLFDDRLLQTAVALRHRYGPMRVNDWYWGGRLHYRGYREPACTDGAEFSDHRHGRALDCDFARVSAEQVRKDILADPWHPDFRHITCLEMTQNNRPINWLHFSTRNWDKEKHGILELNV